MSQVVMGREGGGRVREGGGVGGDLKGKVKCVMEKIIRNRQNKRKLTRQKILSECDIIIVAYI